MRVRSFTHTVYLFAILATFAAVSEAARAQVSSPVLGVEVDPGRPRVNTPLRVTYEVSWSGEAAAYAVTPSDAQSVVWGASELVETRSGVRGDAFFVANTVEFIPAETGKFEIPPFEVAYFDPATLAGDEDAAETEQQDPVSALDKSVLLAEAIPISIGRELVPMLRSGTLLALVAGFCAVGAVLGYRRRRTLASAAGAVGHVIPQTAQGAINLARQYRLDARFYEFYRELARGAELLAPSVAARRLREKLESDAQNVGYRGAKPTEDDMEGALRDLEQVMKSAPADEEE